MNALQILFSPGFDWRVKYALRMRERTLMDWDFCWEAADIGMEESIINEGADISHVCPVDECDNELSCWSD